MADNSKSGCITWIVILCIIGAIIGAVQECQNKHHKRQQLILPEYSTFKTEESTNPQIFFQTFDSQTEVCLNFFWESGTSAPMYVTIKDGNDLFDQEGTFCGYIIVRKDGSFDIKGWKEANGHYVGVDGARMSFEGSKLPAAEEGVDDEEDDEYEDE